MMYGVPVGVVKQQHCARTSHGAGDRVGMELHGFAVGVRQSERRAGAASRADGAKQVGTLMMLVGGLARACASSGPWSDADFLCEIVILRITDLNLCRIHIPANMETAHF